VDARAWRRFRRNRGAVAGAVLVAVVLLVALLGPALAPFPPDEQFADALDRATGLPVDAGDKYLLGADQLGRDELSRILQGGRTSLGVALCATLLAVFVGLSIGVLAGYVGGPGDILAMRGIDLLLSLPFLLVAIVVNRVVDSPSLFVLCGLLGGLSWMTLARITRAKTMQVRELEYVQAARAMGMSRARIVLRHVLPNVVQPAIIIGTTLVAQMIIAESAMSFLGLGVRPPAATWGSMLSDGATMLSYKPMLVYLPSAMIAVTVFGFNLLGEGLRDALDPKDAGGPPAAVRGGRKSTGVLVLASLGLVALCASQLGNCSDPRSGPRWMGAHPGDATPRYGGTFVFHHETDVRGFDPHVAFDELAGMGIKLMFDCLLDYDYELNLVPSLAIALPDVSEDGKTFTFRLRHGVRFHNGRELVAEDVRWSLERMLRPDLASPGVAYFAQLEGVADFIANRAPHVSGIVVVDRYTVRFQLREPDQTFLNALAMPFAAPVPRESYGPRAVDVGRHPVGTGPYMLEDWEPGIRVSFRRNPRYWRPGKPYADRMVFELNLQREAAFMRFLAGDLDHVHRLTPADRLFLARSRAWAPYREAKPGADIWGLEMNVEMAPFDDVHVRRAVAFVIDRERWSLSRNHALEPLGQALPAGFAGHDPRLPGVQTRDLVRAREEMRLAGHPTGLAEPVTLWIGEGPTGKVYGELAQANLAEIGIRVELKPVSYPVYLRETGRRRTAQMVYGGWTQDFPDPATFFDPLFHSRSATSTDATNRSFYKNPTLDALLDRARSERDRTRRVAMYREANEIVTRDAPWAFAFSSSRLEAWQPYVHGYRIHPVWTNCFRDVWLDLPRQRMTRRYTPRAGMPAALLPFGAER
jgi:ABC-type dipeptide/oligopeptide/nickel transport system permease subunit/ABC-type transport system substrate-binding protein